VHPGQPWTALEVVVHNFLSALVGGRLPLRRRSWHFLRIRRRLLARPTSSVLTSPAPPSLDISLKTEARAILCSRTDDCWAAGDNSLHTGYPFEKGKILFKGHFRGQGSSFQTEGERRQRTCAAASWRIWSRSAWRCPSNCALGLLFPRSGKGGVVGLCVCNLFWVPVLCSRHYFLLFFSPKIMRPMADAMTSSGSIATSNQMAR
jgi:hypothetical protein